MTGSGARAKRESAVAGGADGDRMVILSLLARQKEHARWGLIALL
jgi:hypothetical protein